MVSINHSNNDCAFEPHNHYIVVCVGFGHVQRLSNHTKFKPTLLIIHHLIQIELHINIKYKN